MTNDPLREAEALRALGVDVSRETLERLKTYDRLLKSWAARTNLVSRHSLAEAWTRHFLDSAQLAPLAGDAAESWLDLGSGAGFPGLVVAILRPDLRVTCIEADRKKVAFLRTVARETGTPVTILPQRIESVPPQDAGIVSARALAALADLMPLIVRHLAPGGAAVLPKGKTHHEEVSKARETWSFEHETIPSRVDPDSVILKIRKVEKKHDA